MSKMSPVVLVVISCAKIMVMLPGPIISPASTCVPVSATVFATTEDCAVARLAHNRDMAIPGFGYCVVLKKHQTVEEDS